MMHRYIGTQPTVKSPRIKTQEYIEQIRKEDWLKSAYYDEALGFYIPADVVDAAIASGAKRNKKGKDFKAFFMSVGDRFPLRVFSGPQDNKGKFLTGRLENHYVDPYIDVRGVVIQTNRIDRCRPVFPFWGLEFQAQFDDSVLDIKDVEHALVHSSIGDFRPRFGRFDVARLSAVKVKGA